ncbi:hypothetical protein Hanom_Chr04g00368281 [Helianthus anomalus]
MMAFLKISCEDLIRKYDCTDPKILPPQMESIIGETRMMHISRRSKNQLVVTNVIDVPNVREAQSSSAQHCMLALPPTTPNPKINLTKRTQPESPGI